ncbi:MAG: DAK2 domain-containing protein [Ruminococcaceae bacterium]|nr:DAK2 domain-containing protein [Oscillospiraceae bacterium]
MIKQINGKKFADMIISGANNLCNQKSIVDNLNVFPVPDGDTGTNMSLTISAAKKEISANSDKNIYELSKILANATLRGARGNSGVILSQLIRGVNKGIKNKQEIDAFDLANALKSASDTAYGAVMKPTEGTILTVARETAEFALKNASADIDIIEFFEKIVEEANNSLAKTQFILPQLKQAGVVDAGGKGLVCILEGALYALKEDSIIELSDDEVPLTTAVQTTEVEADIKFKYCTEFLINKKAKNVDVFKFKSTIEYYGDCMLVIDDDDVVKVHIHTNTPNLVLGEALRLGELINIKIDNMKYQHDEKVISQADKKQAEKENAMICVSVGEGIKKTFLDLGVDHIIEGGQTMNPSTDDILAAIESVNARNVYVFPNNKNIILAAEQAQKLSDRNVVVIPTKSIPQAISAILVYDEDASVEENKEEMCDVISGVKCVQVTTAVRDTNLDGLEIKTGDILSIIDGKISFTGQKPYDVLLSSIEKIADDDTAVITVFCGEEVTKEEESKLKNALLEEYEDCDITVTHGGQPVYQYIASAE